MPSLIDTHTFLWMTSDESRLSAPALSMVKSAGNALFLSIASEWELAIKVANGRLSIGMPLQELLIEVPRRFSIGSAPHSSRASGRSFVVAPPP